MKQHRWRRKLQLPGSAFAPSFLKHKVLKMRGRKVCLHWFFPSRSKMLKCIWHWILSSYDSCDTDSSGLHCCTYCSILYCQDVQKQYDFIVCPVITWTKVCYFFKGVESCLAIPIYDADNKPSGCYTVVATFPVGSCPASSCLWCGCWCNSTSHHLGNIHMNLRILGSFLMQD